jgi:hypothetical protein
VDIRRWWSKLRGREDERALERAEDAWVENPEGYAEHKEGIDDLQADERTARFAGEATIEDAERLGE